MERFPLMQRINDLREQKGWSVYELAKRADMNHATIYSWESRGSSPSLDAITNICNAFNITLAQFFYLDKSNEKNIEEQYFISKFTNLDPKIKKYIMQTMDFFENSSIT